MKTNYREAVACLEEFSKTLHGHSHRKFTNLLEAVRSVVYENTVEVESKTEDGVLKRVLDWCSEMARDHHEYIVCVLNSDELYIINRSGQKVIPSISNTAVQFYNYRQHKRKSRDPVKYQDELIVLEGMLNERLYRDRYDIHTAFNDLLYSNDNIYVFSPHTTLKRMQRLTLCGCISEAVRNGTFNYYEY